MKWIVFVFLTTFVVSGCEMRKKEQRLDIKEAALNQKEQELIARENSLNLKEEDLISREKLLDSTSKIVADTLSTLFPNLPGTYNVVMKGTQTTCPGSAVGDTKLEQWELSFQNNSIIVKAMSDNKLVRVYSGTYVGNSFELLAQQDHQNSAPEVSIVVRIQPLKADEMVGRREIIREKDCRIVYDLSLKKQ